jgi:hypothetical protein
MSAENGTRVKLGRVMLYTGEYRTRSGGSIGQGQASPFAAGRQLRLAIISGETTLIVLAISGQTVAVTSRSHQRDCEWPDPVQLAGIRQELDR